MKKFWVLLMCVVMCLGLIACNSEPDDTDRDDDASAAATQTMETVSTATVSATVSAIVSTPTPEATSASGVTLEQFVTLIQPQIDAMKESLEESGQKLDIIARDKSLVYIYQYTVDVGDVSAIRDGLEAAMESLSSNFEGILDQLQSAVPEAESVIVEYLDKDVQLIYSKEYK